MKGGIGNLMKQAQAMQAAVQKAQAEIATIEVTGESGGGMVKVTMNGRHEASLVIRPPAILVLLRQIDFKRLRRPPGYESSSIAL